MRFGVAAADNEIIEKYETKRSNFIPFKTRKVAFLSVTLSLVLTVTLTLSIVFISIYKKN